MSCLDPKRTSNRQSGDKQQMKTPASADSELVVVDDGSRDGTREIVADMAVQDRRIRPIAQAPVSLVVSAVYSRTTGKYGQRGVRYADIEAGCAAQNIFLVAEALGLGAGIVGAFDDNWVRGLTGAASDSTPLLVMPVGYR